MISFTAFLFWFAYELKAVRGKGIVEMEEMKVTSGNWWDNQASKAAGAQHSLWERAGLCPKHCRTDC